MRYLLSLFLLGSLLLHSCQQGAPISNAPIYQIDKNITEDSAMVVSAHPLASDVGAAILAKGGNAVDAVIAVQFALAVVYPRAGNIGGGGFMVIRQADGTIDALDYREKAPAAADRDMYLDSAENVIKGLSTIGHLASGVPGTVAGMWDAHKKYGKLEWPELVRPAYELAKNGFQLSITEANRLNRFQPYFKEYNTAENIFTKQDTFLKGFNLVQSELATTLKLIEEQGKDGFYKGKTAELLVEEMQRGEGIITMEDLENYDAKWRSPVTADYRNYRLISMPPSSSGGIAVAQMLKMIENYPLSTFGFHTPESVHLMAEVERRAFADRSKHLGDSDFYNVPMEELLSEEYLKERMADYDDYYPTSSDSISGGAFEMALESFETTHTSIVDSEGNAVSVTTTLNSNYGSKVVVGGAGFFMNNEMDDFSSKPGIPNQFGLVGAEANAIQPGKRMLSSMTPSIVEKDGKLFMVVGAPGGSTIITAVFQTILNVIEFDMDLNDAVQAGRFHHQWRPDEIWIEKGNFPSAVKDSLEARGYNFRELERMAIIKAIEVLPNGDLNGVGDVRNPDDDAEGF
ncbi:MAG: gamma-glutamyltransferase [Bacteroidota bacterium]